MKYSTREITLIAIVVAIMISVGYILYVVGSVFPGSGSKFVTMAPFLSFMLTILISKIKKIGVIFSTSLIFGGTTTVIILSICIYALGLFGSYMGLKLASLKSIKYS